MLERIHMYYFPCYLLYPIEKVSLIKKELSVTLWKWHILGNMFCFLVLLFIPPPPLLSFSHRYFLPCLLSLWSEANMPTFPCIRLDYTADKKHLVFLLSVFYYTVLIHEFNKIIPIITIMMTMMITMVMIMTVNAAVDYETHKDRNWICLLLYLIQQN